MSDERLSITNGIFTLIEGENENQFYFYRNDGKVLGDVGRIPMDFYQDYILSKMMSGAITETVMNNLCFENSADKKCIRITVYPIGKEQKEKSADKKKDVSCESPTVQSEEEEKSTVPIKTQNIFKRIFNKIFNLA